MGVDISEGFSRARKKLPEDSYLTSRIENGLTKR